MSMVNKQLLVAAAGAFIVVAGCAGDAGPAGAAGENGAAGAAGATGGAGATGANGTNGTNGTNGDAGATGATGAAAPNSAPAIALVTPDRLLTGRQAKVTVLAVGTTFTSATLLDFGTGITASTPRVLSAVSLEVNVTIAADAALGARALTVTTGASVVTQTNAFTVDSAVGVSGMPGRFATGSEGVLRVSTSAPRSFMPEIGGVPLPVSNAAITAPAGIAMSGIFTWRSSVDASKTFAVSPFFAASSAAFTVTYNEGGTDVVNQPIVATPVVALTTAPAAGTLDSNGGVAIYTYAAAAGSAFAFNVTPAQGSSLTPKIRVYNAGVDTPIATINGTTWTTRSVAAATYTIVVTDANYAVASGTFDFTASVSNFSPELEPNNDKTAATALTAGASMVAAIAGGEKDFYTFTLAGTEPRFVRVRTSQLGTTAADTKIYFCTDAGATCVSGESRTNNSGFDDNSGVGSSSLLSALLPAGKWHVVVEPSSSSAVAADYLIRLDYPTATIEVEPNLPASPTVLPAGNVGYGAFSAADASSDSWKVTLARGDYFFQTRPLIASDTVLGNADTQMWICTEDSALASSSTCNWASSAYYNDDSGPYSYSELTYTVTTAGVYYVGVQSYNGTSYGNYLLTVDRQ